MTDRQITDTLEQIIRYFGRCYLNAGNGTKAKEQYKTYMAAVGVAKYKVEHGKKKSGGGYRKPVSVLVTDWAEGREYATYCTTLPEPPKEDLS